MRRKGQELAVAAVRMHLPRCRRSQLTESTQRHQDGLKGSARQCATRQETSDECSGAIDSQICRGTYKECTYKLILSRVAWALQPHTVVIRTASIGMNWRMQAKKLHQCQLKTRLMVTVCLQGTLMLSTMAQTGDASEEDPPCHGVILLGWRSEEPEAQSEASREGLRASQRQNSRRHYVDVVMNCRPGPSFRQDDEDGGDRSATAKTMASGGGGSASRLQQLVMNYLEKCGNGSKHFHPIMAVVTGQDLKDELTPSGELTLNLMRCIHHMLSQKGNKMYRGWLDRWRGIFYPCFLVCRDDGDKDWDYISTRMNSKFRGYRIDWLKKFMFLVNFMDCWSLYILDSDKKITMALDPTETNPSDEMKIKHEPLARKFQQRFCHLFNDMFGAGLVKTMAQHEPCSREDSGIYAAHYIMEFIGLYL